MSQIHIPILLGKPSQEIYRVLPDAGTVALKFRRGVIDQDRKLIQARIDELNAQKDTRHLFGNYKIPTYLHVIRDFDWSHLCSVDEEGNIDLAIKAIRGVTPLKPEEQRKLANWVFQDNGEIKPLAQFSSLASMALREQGERQRLVGLLVKEKPWSMRSAYDRYSY